MRKINYYKIKSNIETPIENLWEIEFENAQFISGKTGISYYINK